MTVFLLVAAIAYLLGSIPSGYIAGRVKGVDLRKEGSGNVGATNALRVLGKKLGYMVFAADLVKGAAAVWAGYLIAGVAGFAAHGIILSGVLAGVAVVVGHNFPVWLGFKGGKGIATSGGVAMALFPFPVFLAGLVAWIFLFFATRYVSVASIAAALALPTTAFTMWAFGTCDLLRASIALLMCGLAIWRHKPNIGRLMVGTEKRFEKKKDV